MADYFTKLCKLEHLLIGQRKYKYSLRAISNGLPLVQYYRTAHLNDNKLYIHYSINRLRIIQNTCKVNYLIIYFIN